MPPATNTNHAALTEGLKLYTDAMRALIKERLIAAFPQTWWDEGVLKVLTRSQANAIRRNLKKEPDRDKADLLDPSHFTTIIEKRYGSFDAVFHNYRQTQSYLGHAAEARNSLAAHSRSGDISPDEADHALYAMAQLLAKANLPEAEEVEAIRNRVRHIADASDSPPPPEPTTEVRPAHADSLPWWWQVCEPRDDFKDPNRIDDSLFAATLGGVFAGSTQALDEYGDPVRFLSHTYFTENLTQLTRDIVTRLNGGDGAAVTEVQTPFGGGKTHALLTLYHLLNSPEQALELQNVREALGDLRVPEGARVLVFDGQEVRADSPVIKEDGASVGTLWGELAHQALGAGRFNSLVGESDERGMAPGNEVYRQVLEEASPCLILLDEVVSYLVKLQFSNQKRSQNLYRQTVQFLQEMLQLASNTPGVCVILSLPKSLREFGGIDPEGLQRQIGITEDLQARADRVVSKRTPVNDDEIYKLTRQRLFMDMDEDAARQVARAYRETYDKTPGSYDPAVTSADYLRRMEEAWPLHPELLDVIYKKWSTASDFPRTRATLQLLASVVADQWSSQPQTHAIQPAHVNLNRERIRTRIVSAAGSGGGFDGVVAADITGGDGHAHAEDKRRGGDYARFHIAEGVATALLMHSFGGRMNSGASARELRLGAVAPNLGPEYVTEVLSTLEESLWYVHKEGDRLRFQTKPNIYRVITEMASSQPASTVDERLREEVGGAIGAPAGFRALAWAGAGDQIPDSPDPTVAVLAPRFEVGDSGAGEAPAGAERVETLWDRVGGGLREWRNALVLVAPDRELWGRAADAVRETLAYESVLASGLQNLSAAEEKDLKSRAADKRASLQTSVVTAYRWVFHPAAEGLTPVSLAVPATARERIAERAVARLASQDYGDPKVLTGMGALYFNAKVAPHLWKDAAEPLDLAEALRRFPQWTYLPILPKREETLRECIREGVGNKLWAVAIGAPDAGSYQDLIEDVAELDRLSALFDGSAFLVKDAMRDLIREELRPGQTPEAPGDSPPSAQPEQGDEGGDAPPAKPIPPPARRLRKVTLNVPNLPVAKTNNLQPYLFKVLQQQDAGARVRLAIEVTSETGIAEDALKDHIVEAFDLLGIEVTWTED